MADYELETVTGRDFAGEEVQLDGREFVDCTFRNCALTYAGGTPFILGSPNLQGCTLEFVGAAQNTLNTLRGMQSCGLGPFVDEIVTSIRNPISSNIS
jgi:hypothetical protein